MSDDDGLNAIRGALRQPDANIRLVQTFSHGIAAQVCVKTRKVGPLLLPADGQDLSDVLSMLGKLVLEERGADAIATEAADRG